MRRSTIGWLMALCTAVVAALSLSCGIRASDQFTLVKLAEDTAGGGDGAISPDGRAFVVSSHRSGNWDLWTYRRDTRRWSQVTDDPADDLEAQWSPDGQRLAFTSTRSGSKDVWVMSLSSQLVRRLTFSPYDDEYPAWSPDGRFIVYTGGPWKQRDYFVVPSEGGSPQRVSRESGQAGACSFVADGTSLICHGYDRGFGAVDIISLDGVRTPVTAGPAWDYKPTMQPTGGWIAFSRSSEGPSAIWLQKTTGGLPRPLALTNADDRWPTWTASGDELFFHRLVDRGTGIAVYDRDTERTSVVVGEGEGPDAASFDPTGSHIVYAAYRDGQRVLRIRALAGGPSQTLDTGPGEAAFPRWSPDGRRIAFLSRVHDRWGIAVVPSAGGAVERLTGELRGVYGPIDWSPDGRRIVFHGATAPFESDIFTVDLHSLAVTPFTHDSWFDEAPAWTPDGRSVLFMSTRGGNWTWGLYRRFETGTVETVAGPDYVEKNFPRMARDGAIVWSEFNSDGVERLFERSPLGSVRQLGTGPQHARWPSYSRDGRRIVFTRRDRHVEYWLAQHLFGSGSPLERVPIDTARAWNEAPRDTGGRRDAVSISPRQVHHR